MKPLRVLYFLALVSIFLILISCGNNTSKKPGFELQLSSETLSIKQGESGSVTISLTKTGGFSSAVVMSLEGNPTGVTENFDPASISDTGTLSLSVVASAAAGSSTLTITGTAGDIVKTATLQLTIIENITLEITIAGLRVGVNANVVVTGPNAFQQTLSTSTTLSGLVPGTYTFVVNDVKPDSATFAKAAGPNDIQVHRPAG